jgi:hypothetical protein
VPLKRGDGHYGCCHPAVKLILQIETDMDRDKSLTGKKPLPALNSEELGICFSNGLEQAVVDARQPFRSFYKGREIDSISARNLFAVAESDDTGIWTLMNR